MYQQIKLISIKICANNEMTSLPTKNEATKWCILYNELVSILQNFIQKYL